MSKAGGEDSRSAGGSNSQKVQQLEDETAGEKVMGKLNTTTIGPGWTKVVCPCCVSERVEPLVLVKLKEKVRPETKRWLIRLIGASQKDGGKSSNNSDQLLVHSVGIKFLSPLIAALQRNTCVSNNFEQFCLSQETH